MSDLDLTEAVAAAALAYLGVGAEAFADQGAPSAIDHHIAREIVLEPIAVAAPLIEAQVRALVAVEIETYVSRRPTMRVETFRALNRIARHLARGDVA